MKKVTVYTDGGCRGNDSTKENIGAIGIVLIYVAKNHIREYKEAFENTTNNKMELLAVIKALEILKEPCDISVHSDSAYVVNAYNQGWIDSWKLKGWTRGKSGALKKKELWKRLDELVKTHKVKFVKVKGHNGDEYNTKCDDLVNQAMDEYIK